MSTYDAPNGYSTPIKTMRAAEAKPPTALERFEKEWKSKQTRDRTIEYAILADPEADAFRVATHHDDTDYAPPDPYATIPRAAETPQAARLRAIAADAAAITAANDAAYRALADDDLSAYQAPDPYADPVRRMKE
jgi:hypothetical protein